MPAKKLDFRGKRVGRLEVIEECGRDSKKNVLWECECDCGAVVKVPASRLKTGSVVSCGCYHKERQVEVSTKHGKKHSRVYNIWTHIIQRCTNPKSKSYHNYGGRGIFVCNEWLDFKGFYKDMGDPPDGTSVERINNEDGYYKNNCRWATKPEQNNNKRCNLFFEVNGERLSLKQWADRLGVNYFTLHARYKRGRPKEEILNVSNIKRTYRVP